VGSFTGTLIINADDWGRDRENTERIHHCLVQGTVSSVSAMVFMDDSERAGELARQENIDAGLHLNFTTPFAREKVPAQLSEQHQRVMRYLRRNRLAQVVYHPGLANSFKYVVASQLDEFQRIYGSAPRRLDGHHHMHLSANVMLGELLPSGTIARRNFSFGAGEKGLLNRLYRNALDNRLKRRHLLADYFYSLAPLEPRDRLDRIVALARQFVVEVETHPVKEVEYRFLMGEGVTQWIKGSQIATRYTAPNFANDLKSQA
jgi:hypothetical protein